MCNPFIISTVVKPTPAPEPVPTESPAGRPRMSTGSSTRRLSTNNSDAASGRKSLGSGVRSNSGGIGSSVGRTSFGAGKQDVAKSAPVPIKKLGPSRSSIGGGSSAKTTSSKRK